jgi:hypothetical protein
MFPYDNVVVSFDCKRALAKRIIEVGVALMPNAASGILLEVSGLCYTYNISRAPLDRVTEIRIHTATGCDGPLVTNDTAKVYTCALVDFLASGVQGMPVVTSEPRFRTLKLSGDMVAEYLATRPPRFTPAPIQGRVKCVGAACPKSN